MSTLTKRLLIAPYVVVGVIVALILVREIPGAIRELRMWQMAMMRRPNARQAGAQRARTR